MEFPITQKGTNVPMMRTRAKQKHVASDRARRENVPRHILFHLRNIFTYEAINSALVIHLPKEVDHHNCLTLKYETDLLLAENYINRIIFDFSGTEFMDSSGIGVILNRYKQMEGSSGTVAVYGAGERMRRILRIGGVYRLVQSYRTREEALDGRH